MEILLQGKSRGILYEGYDNAFIQCIYEEGDVSGKNERYEFRCNADLECCGRSCCIPQEAAIPLWLMIIFIILGLLLLLALLGTLAWLCAKRKREKPKKAANLGSASRGHYSTLQAANGKGGASNDRALLVNEHEQYSTPYSGYGGSQRGATAHGYGNRGYGNGIDDAYGTRRSGYGYGDRREQMAPQGYGRRASVSSDGSVVRHNVHEVVQESYKKEITYERPAKKFVPSPMELENLVKPQPVRIVQHSADEISRSSRPDTMEAAPLSPQRAQLAFYRPFVPDPVEESTLPQPVRNTVSYHSIDEISQSQAVNYSNLERPASRNAERMYTRPGVDNVPSY